MKNLHLLPPKVAALIRYNAWRYGTPPEGWQYPTNNEEMTEDMEAERNREFSVWLRDHLEKNGWTDEVKASLQALRHGAAGIMRTPISTGIPSLDAYIGGWQPGKNYVIAGAPNMGLSALALTLGETFAAGGGQLIWIGNYDDLRFVAQRITLRMAGIKRPECFSFADFDDNTVIDAFNRAFRRICTLAIDLCDISQCDDGALEQKFLAEVATDRPTWIVVDQSMFDESDMHGLEAHTRRRNLARVIRKLQATNPVSSVLWQIQLAGFTDGRRSARPSLSHIIESVNLENAEVIMFTHRERIADDGFGSKNQAELIIAKNDFGSTGTIPMLYESDLSEWREPQTDAQEFTMA
jgi:replicative DNA helicase